MSAAMLYAARAGGGQGPGGGGAPGRRRSHRGRAGTQGHACSGASYACAPSQQGHFTTYGSLRTKSSDVITSYLHTSMAMLHVAPAARIDQRSAAGYKTPHNFKLLKHAGLSCACQRDPGDTQNTFAPRWKRRRCVRRRTRPTRSGWLTCAGSVLRGRSACASRPCAGPTVLLFHQSCSFAPSGHRFGISLTIVWCFVKRHADLSIQS